MVIVFWQVAWIPLYDFWIGIIFPSFIFVCDSYLLISCFTFLLQNNWWASTRVQRSHMQGLESKKFILVTFLFGWFFLFDKDLTFVWWAVLQNRLLPHKLWCPRNWWIRRWIYFLLGPGWCICHIQISSTCIRGKFVFHSFSNWWTAWQNCACMCVRMI